MNVEKIVKELAPKVREIRRILHQYPELSGKEFETNKIVCQYLEQYGIEYQNNIAETGVVAIVRGASSGKTVGVRADMDALPVEETNEGPFRSVNQGVMHACGHDAHTAILLGTAIAFKRIENELIGNVKFFFQPAEEEIGGALRMIKDGCLENPKVDYIIGLHVEPNVPTGKIQLKRGQVNAASTGVNIKQTPPAHRF